MARPKRNLKKTFVIFCEGDTEYNYFNGMKNLPDLEMTLKPINMHGGGYKSFLQAVKKETTVNRIATFIVVDGDRAQNISSELQALKDLQEYCVRQNKKDSTSPYFLIVDCPNFEYVACLHDLNYSDGNVESHIRNKFQHDNIASFKSNSKIFSFLNSDSKNYKNAIERLEKRHKVISNEYERSGIFITLLNSITNWDLIGHRNSNIAEIFNIVLDS